MQAAEATTAGFIVGLTMPHPACRARMPAPERSLRATPRVGRRRWRAPSRTLGKYQHHFACPRTGVLPRRGFIVESRGRGFRSLARRSVRQVGSCHNSGCRAQPHRRLTPTTVAASTSLSTDSRWPRPVLPVRARVCARGSCLLQRADAKSRVTRSSTAQGLNGSLSSLRFGPRECECSESAAAPLKYMISPYTFYSFSTSIYSYS